MCLYACTYINNKTITREAIVMENRVELNKGDVEYVTWNAFKVHNGKSLLDCLTDTGSFTIFGNTRVSTLLFF